MSEREETADGERTGEGGGGGKLGPGMGARSSSQFPVPGLVAVPVPGDQDRIGRKSWKGKGRGWPGLGGRSWEVRGVRGVGVWWRRGDLVMARQTSVRNRGAASRSRGAEHSRAEQSRAASTATMRTSTISSPSENCVKGSATPPDCPPPYCAHRDKFFSLSSTYKCVHRQR